MAFKFDIAEQVHLKGHIEYCCMIVQQNYQIYIMICYNVAQFIFTTMVHTLKASIGFECTMFPKCVYGYNTSECEYCLHIIIIHEISTVCRFLLISITFVLAYASILD